MYKSYSYNNMPQPVNTASSAKQPQRPPMPTERESLKKTVDSKSKAAVRPALSRLQSDDMVLLIVIIILIMNECDDKLLLFALAYIFLSD